MNACHLVHHTPHRRQPLVHWLHTPPARHPGQLNVRQASLGKHTSHPQNHVYSARVSISMKIALCTLTVIPVSSFCSTSTAVCCASRPTTRHSSATATLSATTAKASSTTELSVCANFRRREHQQDTPQQLLSCRQLQRWPLQLHRRC